MSAGSRSVVDAAGQLCVVLERIAEALVRLDNEALLNAEADLAPLVGTFDAVTPAGVADRALLEAWVRRGRAALMRCHRLGASFTAIARARLAACSAFDTYSRAGAVVDPRGPSPTVRAAI
jgi:hypothetical protein